MAKYLLPCSCGRKTPVEPRQAGQSLDCACGASLEVPTMLAMSALEPADSDIPAERSTSVWGARQIMTLLGIALLLGGVVLAIGFLWTRPARVTPEMIREHAKTLTPLGSMHYWRRAQALGLDPSLPVHGPDYKKRAFRYRVGMGAAAAVALAGIVLIGVAWQASRRRIARSAP